MLRWTCRTLGIVALAVVAALLTSAVLTSADRRFEARVAQLRAEGFATTSAEFLGPAPPGAERAAAKLRAAWNALGTDLPANPDPEESGIAGRWSKYQYGEWMDPEYPERRPALVAWLEEVRPFYDRVSAAVAQPEIRFRRKLDKYGVPVDNPYELLEWITAALEARARAASDPTDRIAACRDMLRLGRKYGHIDLEQAGLIATRGGVTSGDLDPRRAREVLDDELIAPPLDLGRVARECIACRIEFWSAVLRGRRTAREPDDWERLAIEARRLAGAERFDYCGCGGAHGHGRWNTAHVLTELDLAAALARAPERWPRHADPPLPDAVRQEEASAWARVGERRRQHAAALELARVALAVKARADANGRWPESLDDVADAFGGTVPRDPFGNVPFVYEIDADGAVRLASVGRDPSDSPLRDEERLEECLIWEFPGSERTK